MDCLKCGTPLENNGVCSSCGVPARFYKKATNTAYYYYNSGLEKAQIRDLSGAIEDLKIALKYKKDLTDARNLLGLVYYEMGEMVLAISEWVVSLHLQKENNVAEQYVNYIQDNPARLENVNQVVKKYNQTLTYARQNNEDMALIQLKKVLSLNPNFVNGHLLLALLYIQAGSPDKAKKAVEKVLKIDAHNVTALRYMGELTGVSGKVIEKEEDTKKVDMRVNTKPVGKYKEPVSSMKGLVYIFMGAVIAAVAMWFLVIPSIKEKISEDLQKNYTTVSEELSVKKTEIKKLQEENKTLKATNDKNQKELKKYRADGTKNIYDNLLLALQYDRANDSIQVMTQIAKIKESELKTKTSKDIYKELKEKHLVNASRTLYSQGWSYYNAGRYEEGLPQLKQAYEMNKENYEALYFLARSYDRLGKVKEAKKYYEELIKKFPDTVSGKQAVEYLKQLPQQ